MLRRRPALTSAPFRFRCGAAHFTRHFTETTDERRLAAAEEWARAKGYVLVSSASR
jgi:hypothetical protein